MTSSGKKNPIGYFVSGGKVGFVGGIGLDSGMKRVDLWNCILKGPISPTNRKRYQPNVVESMLELRERWEVGGGSQPKVGRKTTGDQPRRYEDTLKVALEEEKAYGGGMEREMQVERVRDVEVKLEVEEMGEQGGGEGKTNKRKGEDTEKDMEEDDRGMETEREGSGTTEGGVDETRGEEEGRGREKRVGGTPQQPTSSRGRSRSAGRDTTMGKQRTRSKSAARTKT